MSTAVLGSLVALALVDSLNPATIMQAGLLSGGARPVRAVLSFWAGALLAYLVLGVVMVLGPATAIRSALSDPPAWVEAAGVVVGPALLLGGAIGLLRLRRRRPTEPPGALTKPRAGLAFGLGVVTTGVDAFTALPYFAAAAIVTGLDISTVGQVLVLAGYNLVYLLPVLLVLGLRLALGKRLDAPLRHALGALARYGTPVLLLLGVAGGAALTVIGVGALSL